MRGFLMAIVALVGFVALIAIFPVIQEGRQLINTTTNVTQYEGMAQVADFSPLAIVIGFGLLLLLAVIGLKIRGHRIFGGDNA